MIRVLHILPRVPPAICGIGDYAWLLAGELRDAHGMHSSFLASGTHWTKPEGETEFPVFRLSALTAEALLSFLDAHAGEFEAVILHLSPYGYQKRAVPFWLAAGWRRFSQRPKRPRLLTMFHELYASGSVTSSAFWLQPWQKRIIKEIARCSDALRTNREAYADWLSRVTGRGIEHMATMPVFSNLGEGSTMPLSANRWDGMTVFASSISVNHHPLLPALCQRLGIKRLGWIGSSPPLAVGSGVTIKQVDHLPAEQATAWFEDYGFACTSYHPEFLAKSGIFAAYAAHRMAVVLPAAPSELPDGLSLNREFMTWEGSGKPGENSMLGEEVATGLHHWYQPHNRSCTAASYAGQLRI